ncbi:MAG: methylenetetrahydrofolate reductase [NAD(P)H] [Acidiferrobacter sp.]
MDSQKSHARVFSFEFFPPKSADAHQAFAVALSQLLPLQPRFFSVTFGAGGSTRDRTLETAREIGAHGAAAAPHLSCIGATREGVREILNTYKDLGIRHLVALRGDLPSGMVDPGDFRYAAELVGFIRAETGDHFHIEVAAYPEVHPQALGATADLRHFQAKVLAGADSAITQYFYNADAYYWFVDACASLNLSIPIVPGIMPITNHKQLVRFSDACGAEVPRWIRRRLEDFGDDNASVRAFGLDVTTALCAELLAAGAPGLHFYTLNRATPVTIMWERLGL